MIEQDISRYQDLIVTTATDVGLKILDFTLVEPVLAVRPYCHNDNCRQVYFDTSEMRGFGRDKVPGAGTERVAQSNWVVGFCV